MLFRSGFACGFLLLFLLAVVTAEDTPETDKPQPKVEVKDYLHSRVAPNGHGSTSMKGAYVITEEKIKEIRSELMYWYFDQGGDHSNGDYLTGIHGTNPQCNKNLTFELPFFGLRYNYTRVNLGGYLEFSDPPEHYIHPIVFPNPDWPQKNDPSIIGVFFSNCDIGFTDSTNEDKRKPGVYYRVETNLQNRTDQFGVEVRERVTQDIREGKVGAEKFNPVNVAIVTWKDVSFAGGVYDTLNKTNTFQIVLATDEVASYAMYNYERITWTSDTEAGGNITTGLGGVPAFIGFNAGNGTGHFEYLPFSQDSKILNITVDGCGNGFGGRHIFRIDDKIIPGTCN